MSAALAGPLDAAGLFDPAWYVARYPDVARLGIDPRRHFLELGLALGRDPGPGFCSHAYLAANADVARAGVPALVHYLQSGRAEGRALHPAAPPALPGAMDPGLGALLHQRALLETGGLEAAPLAAIAAVARDTARPGLAAEAARILALWALRAEDGAAALGWLDRLEAPPRALRLLATAMTGDREAAERLYSSGNADLDTHLAATHAMADPRDRAACLGRALAVDGLAPVTLAAGDGPAFDRLHAAATGVADGPLVSVLMATHDAAATLPAAIASVLGQSWRALELLVIDDASSDATPEIVTEWAARDPRLRLVRLERNRGAYGARNAGLAEARGDHVTLHDADDWAHPERLARQMAALRAAPWELGNLGLQARLTPDLRLSRWTGEGAMVFENLSSLVLPRAILLDVLGGWDEVRVSADSELLRRVRHLFGARALGQVGASPLAFQRDGGENATADPATGMGWFYYGARRDYFEAQRAHHAGALALRYTPGGPRPFPVPEILKPGGAPREIALDRVYAGLLMMPGPGLETLCDWLEADRAAGRRVGLVGLMHPSVPRAAGLALHPRLRSRVDGDALQVLVYGERARCHDFRLLPGTPEPVAQRYLPEVVVDGDRVLGPDTRATAKIPVPAPPIS